MHTKEQNDQVCLSGSDTLIGNHSRPNACRHYMQAIPGATLCRYLAESGCVGMCVNLCKTPTQTFFTEELGMPLTMKPNFEDYSCDMVFGEVPPSLDTDEVNTQACYDACPQGKAGLGKCHKLG